MAPLHIKTEEPTSTPSPHQESTDLPAYDESSAATAAGERAPFIQAEAQAQPPAYEADPTSTGNAIATTMEMETEAESDDDAFAKQSLPVKILTGVLGFVLFAVGFGGILTLGVVFLKLLVLLWHKLGLV
ncbi:hypothetical protein F5Y06DRAFT_27833 [Hypoxylon sp. FL0890]|nr:hypothetical protein F5Y06DRAFT_27833 [Hypoxylon sp. FL0890]